MREKEVRGLMEAYSQVYTPQELTEEQVWEEVETIEEASDLEMGLGRKVLRDRATQAAKPTPVVASSRQLSAADRNRARMRPGRSSSKPQIGSLPPSARQVTQYPDGVSTGVGGGNAGASRQQPPAKSAPAITNTPSAKPTATTAAKPAAPAAKQTGDKTKDMATFAKANPKLAAAAAERDRTRGTSATTNPLMKDMKSRLPAPKTPSPTTAKTGFDLAKKGVNLAAGVDLFDVVKGYLLDEGYAESEDAAMVIMVNMSEEWRESILESYGVELVMELTGGKGHPGYKAGSRDLGPMQSGHPADSRKRQVDGGTMSQRHGYHLGDIDDDDDDEDEDEYESIVKQQSRDKREILRKPLRKKVKSARKAMTKEEMELDESQYARENPEKYERSSEAREGRRRRSGINDPNTGINSPAFQAFMAQQMGGKKKKKD